MQEFMFILLDFIDCIIDIMFIALIICKTLFREWIDEYVSLVYQKDLELLFYIMTIIFIVIKIFKIH